MKWLEKAQSWLSQHPTAEALLWFVTAVACIAILVWFLLFSGYALRLLLCAPRTLAVRSFSVIQYSTLALL